jgi:excisionase family DNA binding protein
MAIIQTRDITIFKGMRFGPMTISGIRASFQNENESEEDANLTLPALKQRIHILSNDGYIKSCLYSNLNVLGVSLRALYCLTDRSIEELVKRTDIPVESVRSTLPSRHTVIHELLVTYVVRTLNQESKIKKFEFDYFDENLLRQRIEKKKPRKRYVFPDLEVITYHGDKTIKFKIEVDRGTISELRVAKKIDLLSNSDNYYYVIVLCEKRIRIERLKQALRTRTYAMYHKNIRNVFFALTSEFQDGMFTAPYSRILTIRQCRSICPGALDNRFMSVNQINYTDRERVRKRLYSIEEAAIYLGRTVWAVREMIWAKKIRCVRDGRRILLDIHDMDKWIDDNKT